MAALNPKLEVQLGLNKLGLDKGLSGAKGGLMGLDKTVGSVTGKLGRLGSAFASVAKIAGGFVIAQVFLSITRAIGGAIKAASDFQTQMRNVNSIAQLGEAQFGALNDQVLELALNPQIKDGPAVLAAGLYDIVSSGFDATDALVILEAASIAASAGLTTTATSSAAITAVLNAYGLQAKDAAAVSDTLFQTVNLGVLTFEQLAGSIGTVLPTAKAAGVSLNELGAAYATLTRQGVNADEATTQINAVLTGLLKPTDALTDALHAQGYESGYALLKAKGLGGALEVLNKIVDGNAESANDLFADVRQVRGILGLTTDDGKLYTEMLDGMGDASDGAGATQKALAEQMKSSAFQIAVLKKNLQVLAILGFGAIARPLNFVVRGLSKFVLALVRVGQYVKQVLKGVTTVTKSFGAMGTGITETSHNITDALAKIPAPLRGIAKAFGEVALYVRSFTMAMKAAFDSGVGIRNIVEFLPAPLQRFEHGLLLVADAIGDLVARWRSHGFKAMLEDLPGELDQAWQGVKELASNLGGLALDVLVDVASWSLGAVPNLWHWLKGALGLDGGTFGAGDPEVQGLPKGEGLSLSDVLVNIKSWAFEELLTGKFVTDLTTWAQAKLKDHNVTITDWKITLGTPDTDNITIDVAAIWKAITDKLTAPLTVSQETVDAANTKGNDLGLKVWGWVWSGVNSFFGGSNEPTDDGKVGIDAAAQAFIRGFFGGFFEAADHQIDRWMIELQAWSQRLNGRINRFFAGGTVFTPAFGGATQETTAGIFSKMWDGLKDALTPDFSDWTEPSLPDWLTNFLWFTGPVGDLVRSIEDAVQDLKNAWHDLQFWQDSTANGGPPATPDNPVNPTQIPSSQPGMVDGELVTALPGTGTGSGISIPVPDFSGALKAITDFTASASAAFVGMRLTVSMTVAGLQGDLSKQWAGIRDNTLATAQQVQQQTGAIFSGMRADLLGIVGSLQAGAAGIFAGMRSDLVGIAGSIRGGVDGQFAGMRGDVLGILGGLAYSAGAGGYQIGDALGSGIYYGMAAWVSSIANLAANTVYGAIAAADAAAGHPHSPSPVTRKHIGSPLGEGIFAGIMDWQRPIGNAMAGLVPVGGSTSRARSLNAMPTAPRIAMQNSRGATRPVIVHQTVKIERAYGIDDLAVQMAPALNQGLTEVLREVRRARGVA